MIKRMMLGINHCEERVSEIEVWMQQYCKKDYTNTKTGETLDFAILKQREGRFGSSRLIIVSFVEGKSIL